MASGAPRLGGPNATGKTGDWVLENDQVVFVLDALGPGSGFAESGGNLVDAADARSLKDELGQVFTYFGKFPRQAVYSRMSGRDEDDGSAVVEVRGRELHEKDLEIVTEYRLGRGDRGLLLRTTLKNEGPTAIEVPGLGDAVQWGGTEKVSPGKPLGFRGASRGPYIGGVGRFVSYGLTSMEGDIGAISGSGWTDTEQEKAVRIEPGKSVTYERVLIVGQRGDVASIVAELTRASGGVVGKVEIATVDERGEPVAVEAGAKVIVATEKGEPILSIVAAEKASTFTAELPPGRVLVSYAPSVGRTAAPGPAGEAPRVAVDVRVGHMARATLAVTGVGGLTVGCTDATAGGPLPCKVTLEGIEGTATPELGPAHVASAARRQIFAVTTRTVPLAPGKYSLTFSRGPEYALETETLTLVAGQAASVSKGLRRVVDTTGYLATDFHQHTSASADSGVANEDRVISNAVEGVEVAVASEHNLVADLTPVATTLGLRDHVVFLGGDELTADASKLPWGHANVFPLDPDPTRPRAGAPLVTDRLASAVFEEVRALPGSRRIIQINHPRSGQNGYFDLLDLDPSTGTGKKPGYSPDFDAVEIWNGRNVQHRQRVLVDYLALLRTRHPVTAIADTDTHGVVDHEAGFPRTYVRVPKDDALSAWSPARSDALVASLRGARDVVLTNGPFLSVSSNGVGIGGLAIARGGEVAVKVRVTCAPHVVVDRLELRAAGAAVVTPASAAVTLQRGSSGAMTAEASFVVRTRADDAFVAIASGKTPMRPVFEGDDAEISPWAMTGAIWVDGDGDGKSLGR